MCLERLEYFRRRVACVYVCGEREMCLCQERESCMGVCLYREESDVFGVKDGFFYTSVHVERLGCVFVFACFLNHCLLTVS